MIYCFKACGQICMAPCKACEVFSGCCGNLCENLGKCVSDCVTGCENTCGAACGAICAGITKPLIRPLAGFWVLSMAFGIPVIWKNVTLMQGTTFTCDDGKYLTYAQTAFAVAHILFAFYIQHRLAKGVLEPEEAHLAPADEDLGKKAWELVLYDVGFCLYVPTFIASFGAGCWGFGVDCGNGNLQNILLVTFGILAGFYVTCWATVVAVCGLGKSALGSSKVKRGAARDVQMSTTPPGSLAPATPQP